MDHATKIDLEIMYARARWAFDDLIADHISVQENRVHNRGTEGMLDFVGGRTLATVTLMRDEILTWGHPLPMIDVRNQWEEELERIIRKEIWVLESLMHQQFQTLFRWVGATRDRTFGYLIRVYGGSKAVLDDLRCIQREQRRRGKSWWYLSDSERKRLIAQNG